jgi:hypothetical protein
MEENNLKKIYNTFGKITFYFSFVILIFPIIGDYYDFFKFVIFDEKVDFIPQRFESRLRFIILNVLTVKFVINYKYEMSYFKQVSFLLGITIHFIYNITYWLTMDYSNISRGEIIYNNLPWIWFILIWLMLSILSFIKSIPKKSDYEMIQEDRKQLNKENMKNLMN